MTKRRWFQIHLSTAIVLMFVAGGLLGANLIQQHHYYAIQKVPQRFTFIEVRRTIGFPFWAYVAKTNYVDFTDVSDHQEWPISTEDPNKRWAEVPFETAKSFMRDQIGAITDIYRYYWMYC